MKQFRSWVPLLAILMIAFLVRFLFLESVPTATNLDQLHYILNTKSFALTGTDLSDTIHIFDVLRFRYPAHELPQAELPFFLVFPFVAFFPFSLTLAALPNVLLSTATVALMYLLSREMFNNKVALITALVAAFNPWSMYVGRTLYEVVPATFFYLSFIYLLFIAKKWKILWALPLMLLAFYSYIGTKLIFLPIVFVTLFYTYFFIHKKKYLKQYSILFFTALSLVVFFLFQIHQDTSGSSRLSEIITPSHPAVAERVDTARKMSLDHPFVFLFENKVTAYARLLLENTFNVFSLKYLFLDGDLFAHFERHGLLYVIDLIFLAIGGVWMAFKKRSLCIYIVSLMFIAILPQIIHNPDASGNFAPHITMLFPFIMLIVGVGIYVTISYFPQSKMRGIVALTIGALYVFSIFNFLHIYFFQLPLRTGIFDFPTRLVSHYSVLAKENGQSLIIHSPDTPTAFKKYLFYTNALTKDSVKTVKGLVGESVYSLNNITFVPCNYTVTDTAAVIIHDKICGKPTGEGAVGLPQLKDSGAMYLIYKDVLCKDYPRKTYLTAITLSDLDVEDLNQKEFCETFVLHVE